MSEENVAIVLGGFEAFNAGQPDLSIFDPALVYHPRSDEPDPSPHIGRAAYQRLLDGFLESFSEITFEVLELIDAGDRVIASTVLHARGAASGASVDDAYVFVYEFRTGLVVEGWEYRELGEALKALKAVGLEESAVSQENVGIVRQALHAYARRDVDTLRALADPDLELDWSASRSWLSGVYRGFEETLKFYTDYFDAFEAIVLEADSYTSFGDSVVVPNLARQSGRDGIEVTARSTLVFTLRDRHLTRICLYQGTDEALKAVGPEGSGGLRAGPGSE